MNPAKHLVALLVTEDAVALEIALAQQIFGRPLTAYATSPEVADRPYEVVLCSERRRRRLASGAVFDELAGLDVLAAADTVIVPGIEDPLAARRPAVFAGLRAASEAGARIVSFCAGAFVLAGAGLLDGRRATTHWLLAEEFRRAYPRVHLEPEHLYVQDGPIFTSGGILSATDLSLHLIAADLGQAYANDVARVLVSPPYRPGGQAQFEKPALRPGTGQPNGSLFTWLRAHLHEPLSIADVAAYRNMSERTLIRTFRRETGMTVLSWLTAERVSRAKELLETTDHRIGEVAAMAGFGSYEAFRRAFENGAGVPAAAYRETFRAASPR